METEPCSEVPDSKRCDQRRIVVASRRCLGLKSFILVVAAVIFTQNLVFAVEPATITTIQKEYGLSSFQAGVWFSCFEVGEIIGGLFITYFSGQSHQPRILAVSLVISTVCCLAHALPHFIIDGRHSWDGAAVTPDSNAILEDLCRPAANHTCANATAGPDDTPSASDATTVLAIYCTASFLWGAAWGPTNSLSLVYIDDNMLDKSKTSLFMGAYYAMNYLGPLAGYGLAALTLSYPVNLGATSLKPDSANWVGAWWLGYIVSASIMMVLTFPMFLFPRSMLEPVTTVSSAQASLCCSCLSGSSDEAPLLSAVHYNSPASNDAGPLEEPNINGEEDEESCKEQLPTLRRFFPTMFILVKIPLYVCIVMVSAISSWMDGGYFSYLPKYLESQFHQTSSLADVESGVAWSFVSAVTTVAGGWFISHFHLNVKQCATIVVCCSAVGLVLMGSAMFYKCEQYPILDSRESVNPSCFCNMTEFNPVCAGGNVSYFSPCHAGCHNFTTDSNGDVEYYGCGINSNSTASADVCRDDCQLVYPFLVTVALAYGLPVFSQMACITILMRSVRKELRAFGMGIMYEAVALMAWVPAPMIYGVAIDDTCRLWSQTKSCSAGKIDSVDEGSCLEYDNTSFRYRLHLMTDGALATSCLFAIVACIVAHRRRDIRDDVSVTTGTRSVNAAIVS